MYNSTPLRLVSRNVSEALPELLRELLSQPEVPSRNGTTRELRFPHIVIEQPCERIVTTPGRNALLVAQMAETMWILAGRNDIEWLENYLPRAAEFSDDGITWRGGYGPRIRHFRGVDQLKHVADLLNEDRHTRRAVISIYDAELDSKPGKDVPCNNWLHFLPRDGKLDLHVVARSNDVIWGWSGINAFEWSVLLEVVARMTNFDVGQMHFSVSSFHLYERHYKKAQRIVRDAPPSAARQPMPKFSPSWNGLVYIDAMIDLWFAVEEDVRTDKPGAGTKVDQFPEPLMRSFLKEIEKHWTEKRAAAARARDLLLQNEGGLPGKDSGLAAFRKYVSDLHAAKDAAYGTSWKKRGEQLSILPNICRKADRLENGADTTDETQVDTAIDLFVYAIKYSLWIRDEIAAQATGLGDALTRYDEISEKVTEDVYKWTPEPPLDDEALVELCVATVNNLCLVGLPRETRDRHVAYLVKIAGQLAFQRWTTTGADEYKGADHE